MNQTIPPVCQITGNVCVAIAAIIYLLPLQNLLWEFAHKKNDGAGGALAALILLIPMWLLLWGALTCVAVSGELEWLRLGRPALHVVTLAATLAMAIVSLLFMGMSPRTGILGRIAVCSPIYLFPLATMVLVILSLNPRFAANISPQLFRLPWIIFAVLSLTACVGFVGYRAVRAGGNQLAGITHGFSRSGQLSQENLTKIPTLDPQRDFADLLRLANQHQSHEVREAATARLRTNSNFVETLATELNTSGADQSLEFICSATLSANEQARLALPVRAAIERFTQDIPAANYMSSDRRKQLQRWGRKTLPILAQKFSTTGVDFNPAIAAFERKLDPANRDTD